MRKVLVISVREYLAAVKSKAFVITLVLMPVMMLSGEVIEKVLKNNVDVRDKKFAIIDHSGALFEALQQAARYHNTEEIFEKDAQSTSDKPKQISPRYILEKVTTAGKSENELLLDLSDRVRSGDLFAFAEIRSDVLDPPQESKEAGLKYYSNTPTYRELRRWFARTVSRVVQQWRFAKSGIDRKMVDWASKPAKLEQFGLLALSEKTHQVEPAEKVNEDASFAVPMIMMVLLFMVIMVGASPLIQSVLEEKTLRIAEVILSSVTPFQWMLGKLIGMVGVSLTIVLLYFGGGLVLANRYGVMHFIPFNLLGWFFAYQILSVLMFGALFIAVGSACTDHREAQSAIMPVMILIVLPLMVWMKVAREPSTLFATLISFFPPATPMLMLIRQGIPPGVPVWQPVLGMVLVVLTTGLCIFAAGRIFRVGILMQGKGAGFRDMFRWILSG